MIFVSLFSKLYTVIIFTASMVQTVDLASTTSTVSQVQNRHDDNGQIIDTTMVPVCSTEQSRKGMKNIENSVVSIVIHNHPYSLRY